MRRFTVLRAFVHTRRIVGKAARKAALGLSVLAGAAWWLASAIAHVSGLAAVVGAVVVAFSTLAAGLCWLLSGE